jgi:FKBP-type peptidyl-prolyl cis-trans isomerase SlpA
MTNSTPVGPGTQVSLLFSIELETGEQVDSTGIKPAQFSVGDGNLLPGFESAMFGMKAGEKAKLLIKAESAFGEHNEDNIQRLRRGQFQANMELAVGLMMSFSDKQDAELPGVITKIQGESIEIDFNHPLAGKDIIFDVEILTVEQISNEILRVKS